MQSACDAINTYIIIYSVCMCVFKMIDLLRFQRSQIWKITPDAGQSASIWSSYKHASIVTKIIIAEFFWREYTWCSIYSMQCILI